MQVRSSQRFGGRLARLVVVVACGLGAGGFVRAQTGPVDSPPTNNLDRIFARLPMHFEANHGQADNAVQFLARGRGYTLFLTPDETVLKLRRFDSEPEKLPAHDRLHRAKAKYKHVTTSTLRMSLAQANPHPLATGTDELEGKVNYFLGNDPSQWLSNLSVYRKVKYQGVYPGIDLVYYGNQGQLEYDFIVAPGGDPTAIGLDFKGVDQLEIDAQGNLRMLVAGSGLLWRPPVAYQEIDGVRKQVSVAYALHGKFRVDFQVGDYDRTQPLVIDPKLSFSTYLGGSAADMAWGVAVDTHGYVYVTGNTLSSDFQTVGSSRLWSASAAFVTKLTPGGSNLVFSSYLGGTKNTDSGAFDAGLAIAVDRSTNVYVVGYAESLSFPTPGGFQTTYPNNADDAAFVTRFNSSGVIAYSSYLGGTNDQAAYGVAADTSSNAYVTGWTMSDNFPVKSAFQPTYGGTDDITNNPTPMDAFVAKFNTAKTAANSLVYSTYIGGSDDDAGQAIAVDSSGDAFITGYSYSADYPTTANGILTQSFAFVNVVITELGPTGSSLLYSSYFGGSDTDIGMALALDTNRNVFITGYTYSTDFPMSTGGYQTNFGSGYQNVFVSKLNLTLPPTNQVVYSTYLDGNNANGNDQGQGIGVDTNGMIYVAGTTGSTDFPVSHAFQSAFGGGFTDAFVTKINPAASGAASVVYSTFLGGSDSDDGNAIAVGLDGSVYVAGDTFSTDFPTVGGVSANVPKGDYDAFVAKIIPATDLAVSQSPSANPVALGNSLTYTIIATNFGELVATGVTVTNQLPSNVTYVSASSTVGSCTQSGNVVVCNIGNLPVFAGAVVTINVTASVPGLTTNLARISASQPDPNTNNNAATSVVTLGSIVSVTATTSNAFEQGQVQGAFQFSRTGVTQTSLTINYAVGGTASPGVDYFALPGTFTIPAGFGSGTVLLVPIDNAIPECPETVVVTITSNATYATSSLSTATVTIIDNDLPIVSVVATKPTASEAGPTNGVFTVTRVGCLSSALVVNYAVSGTASSGVDYVALSGIATIPANTNSVTINVQPVNNTTPECSETVIVTLGTNAAYTVGTPASDTVTIIDNDLPSVTITATQPNAAEAGTNGIFTVTRNGCTEAPMTVNYTIGGTASNGLDYAAIGSSVTIPVGATTATITIAPFADALADSNETVVLQLTSNPVYVLGSPNNATVNIADDSAPPTAQFTGAPTTGNVPFVVTFTDSSVGSIDTHTWDFGDGNTTNVSSPSAGVTHFYTIGGTNTVKLTVSGPQGPNTLTRPGYIIAIDIPPQLSVSPTNRNFGSVTIGLTNTQTFTVLNTGGGTLTGNASVNPPFSVAGGYNLIAGQTGIVSIAFAPTSAGPFNGQVIFTSNGGASTNAVTGTGLTAGQLAANPASLNFGSIVTGATAQATLVITNLGGTSVSNGTAAVTGGPYSIVSGNTFSVNGFGATNLVLKFAPVAVGTFTNSIVLNSANGGTLTNTLVGTGLPAGQILVNPLTLNFGTVATTTSAQGTFVVTNTGGGVVNNGTVAFSGGPFSVVSGTPFNLSGGGAANVVVSFTPVSAGGFTNSATFSTSNGGIVVNTVIGTGAVVPTASFTGTPTTGVVSFAVSFTDTSTGTITNRSWDFGDGGTTNTTSTNVVHTYNTSGAFTVKLITQGPVGVNTNTKPGYIVGLRPATLVVSPTSRDFGAVTIGQTNTQTFSVLNAGDVTLTGTVTTLAPFAVSAGIPYSVAAGQSGTITISFLPTSTGTFNGKAIFTSNGGLSTNALIGVGLAPGQIGVSPSALDFGTLVTGTSSQAVFTVTNSGGTTVSNGTATASGAPFSVVSGNTFSVPPGGSTNVVVRFNPSSTGGFTNTVIFSTANGGPSTNAVTGTGAIVPVASFTGTPTTGPVPLVVTFSDASTGTIANRFWDFGDNATTNTTATNVVHTYTIAATNTVRLIVTGPLGVSTNTRPAYIVSLNPPQLIISPLGRDFGQVTVGATNTQTFSVINPGDLTLTGTVTTATPFAISAGSSYTVLPGKTGTVTVAFTPTTTGPISGSAVFSSNGGASTNALTGTGITAGHIVVNPAVLDFGTIVTGTNTQQVFVVTNAGQTTVSNGTATAGGAPFSIVSGSPFTLAGGASTNVAVRFAPGSDGGYTNNVVFNSANGGSSTNVVRGAAATVPVASFSANPTIGGAPLPVTFIDNSTGTIATRAWNFGDGTTTNTPATNVVHTYTVPGTNTVQLTVTGPLGVSSTTQTNLIIALKPATLVVSPASVDFGGVTIGNTNSVVFSVINAGQITLSGTAATAAPYAITNGTPYSVGPGLTGTVTVSFMPLAGGVFVGNVIFNSNGGISTNELVGTGLTPGQISVSPTLIDFGILVTGTVAQSTFVVTNSGGTVISNGVASVTGGPYTVLSGATFDIAPGESTNVVVQFAPLTGDGFTNNVIFTSDNGGNSTNTVRGSGAIVPVAAFSAAPTFGPMPLLVTFTDNSTGTIASRTWDFGDSAGTITTATSVTHTYTVSGTNTVRLVVSGPVGASTNTQANLIVVVKPATQVVTPASRDFGSITVGLTNTLTFAVANAGDLSLNGSAAVSAPFGIVSGSPYTVAPGHTNTITVRFVPTSAGTFNNSVIFSSNGGISTNSVAGVGQTAGQLLVSPASLDFGTVATGSASQRVFTVSNVGQTTVSNGTAGVTGGPFSILSGGTFNLAGGAAVNVTVQFAPATANGFTNAVIVTSANGGRSTNTVTGTGAVIPVASFTASPTSGLTPLTVTFTDNSTGTINSRIWSFGDGGTLATASTSFTYTYNSAGTNTVRLIVAGPVGVSTNTQANLIAVMNPPQLTVSPASANFGPATIGLTNTLTFSVINTGDLALNGTASVPTPFAVTGGTPFNVLPGQTGAVTVVFAPTAGGTFNNSIFFNSNGGLSTNAVSGVGLTPGQIGVSPAALDFGVVATGTVSQRIFTVTNSGGTTVSNGTVTASGAPFTIAAGAAFNLPAGVSSNVVVQFAPVAFGSFNGQVVFNSANGGSVTNTVTGNGAVVPAASFTATPTFGAIPLIVSFTDNSTGTITNRFWSFGDGGTLTTATTNFTHTYTVPGTNTVRLITSGPVGVSTNTQANLIVAVNPPHLAVNPGSLDFGSVTIGLTNTMSFSVTNTGDLPLTNTTTTSAPFFTSGSPVVVAAHQTGTISVAFTPTGSGTFNANVVFTSNGGLSTNAVTGVGLTPGNLAFSPAALDFGTVATVAASQQVFVVSNTGQTTVSNGTAAVGAPFSIVAGNTFGLAGGSSTNVVVRFAPSSANAFTNAVIFNSANGGGSTNPVTGTGAIVPIAIFSGTPTNGAVPLAVTFTDASTGTITNRSWKFGDGSVTNTLATSVTHLYTLAGSNTVQLIVAGPVGVSTNTKAAYIVGVNPPQLVVTPGALNFNSVTIGLTNLLNFTVFNPGDLPLNGTAAAVGPFQVAAGSPYTVPGRATGTVSIAFAPAFAGSVTGSVIFSSNGGASTNTVSGSGLTPGRIAVSPTSADLGVVSVGSTKSQTFTVSNTGQTAVSNGTASVSGTAFTIASGSTFAVSGGGSANVVVQCAPGAAGAFTGTVVFASANGGSATGTVTAIGAIIPVAAFDATPTVGLLPLAVTFTDESTGSIIGRQWTFGDGSTSTTASPTHTYTNSGVFTVSLSAIGLGGTDTVTKANFITVVDTNLFVKMTGTYYGLGLSEPATFANSGLVVMKVSTTGAFSGTFQQGTVKNSFAGLFDKLGNATVNIPRLAGSALTANLHLDGFGSDQVTGTVTEAGVTAVLVADRAVFTKTTASPFAGHRYTVLLAADTTNTVESVPQGDGFGAILIKAPGTVGLSGVTGDGQKFKQTVPISKHGTWPLYVPLYKGLGAVFGWITHSNIVAVSDLDASLHWSKPASAADAFYPAGFADDIGLVGSEYVRPLPGDSVISVANANNNAVVNFGNGNLPAVQGNHVTLTTGNLVFSTNLTMKITTPTGLFKGKFRRADNGSTVPYQGAILQKQNFGSGFFLGTNESGFVTFEPSP